jgi:hypothetical protein
MPHSGRSLPSVREVTVVVSDPWSFVDENGSNVFSGEVLGVDGSLVLVRIAGQLYVGKPRDEYSYNLTPTTDAKARLGAPWGWGDWRGGGTALLAQLQGL